VFVVSNVGPVGVAFFPHSQAAHPNVYFNCIRHQRPVTPDVPAHVQRVRADMNRWGAKRACGDSTILIGVVDRTVLET